MALAKAFIAGVAAAVALSAATFAAAPDLDLDYEKFTLDNGLRVIVHEDHKAPVVAVSVWYHVGSKDEPDGKSGFAHLFEHLMFNGSENYDDEWFAPLQEVGATGLNGTTWFDRTNYFQTVPTPAVDRVLWMESDRMGHLLGAITQDKLDEQRGVVQNEKRQGDNQPYGLVEYAQLEGMFPAGHPYRHSTIGSMEDLDAASLEDVHAWFQKYYGAANAVLVLAGDIDAATAREKAERFFGDIAAGPPLQAPKSWVPRREANTRTTLHDQSAPQARIYRNWPAPERSSRDAALVELAARILGDGKNSRLYKEFVYDKQTATEAFAYLQPFELASNVELQVTLKEESALEASSQSISRILAEFLANGPTADELERAKTKINAETIRGLEEVGGWGGQAVTLAQGELYAGDPGFVETWLQWINEATINDVRTAAREYLSDGWHQVDVLPYPQYTTAESTVDRSTGLPGVSDMPDLTFPAIEEATLANGAKVVLAERHALPVVELSIQFDAGYAADAGGILGAASFTSAMLDEGTKTRTALEIAAQAEALGAEITAASNLDVSSVGLSALKSNLKPSIDLWADIIRNAAFEQKEMDRVRKLWLAAIQQEKANPVQLALRLLPPAMFGEDHAYGVPFTGSGTEASISSLTREDLIAWRETWMRPDNATIFIVGDATMAEVKPLLENAFKGWVNPEGAKPEKNIAAVDLPAGRLVIVDRPGSPQSLILGGHVAPPTGADDNIAIETMNDILGGEFTARVNMNLREDKHWAYGAYTFLVGAQGQRPWLVYAPVQSDKTGAAMAELKSEIDGYLGDQPATEEELDAIRKQRVNELPGSFETAGAVLGSLTANARYGRALDYATTLKDRYAGLGLEAVQAAAGQVLHPENITWVIVGDRSEIESQITDLGWGEIAYWDVDGHAVE